MKNFLSKISELEAVTHVLLLSSQGGELLYSDKSLGENNDPSRWQTCWSVVISGLGEPETADFIFDKGRYYLRQTPIGWLIVGLRNESSLNMVRIACDAVAKKLQAPALRKQTLLRLLQQVDHALKPHVIKELMYSADKYLGKALTELLANRNSFDADQRERLTLVTCQALGYCPYPLAIPELNALTHTKSISPIIANAARTAVKQLEEFAASQSNSPRPPAADVKKQTSSEESYSTKRCNAPAPDATTRVREALQRGANDEAAQLLKELIVHAADHQDFAKADQLLNWQVEVTPLAVDLIAATRRHINQAKQSAIEPAHRQAWQDLIEIIGLEPFTSLYHLLSRQQHVTGELVAFQGQLLPALFFINEGNVVLELAHHDGVQPISTLGPGSVFGAEAFFHPTVWTINARSLGCDLFVLSPENLQVLVSKFPDIEQQLEKLCERATLDQSYFTQTDHNRRQSHRVPASNMVTVLANAPGLAKDNLQLHGKLVDISRHGLSLRFHGIQKTLAETFLGNFISLAITSALGEKYLEKSGSVRAIGLLDGQAGSYLLHIELLEPLAEEELQLLGVEQYR